MSLADWANVATISGAVIAVLVLGYTAYEVHQNTKISRGQFWLELEKMLAAHDEIHLKLRPGGDWALRDKSLPAKGPSTVKEWAAVEDYMGLFEHCENLLAKKLIDIETFKSIFSYRIKNILANKIIVEEKLIKEKDGWTDFLKLLKKLNIPEPRKASEGLLNPPPR
jgi:hypothetical protein